MVKGKLAQVREASMEIIRVEQISKRFGLSFLLGPLHFAVVAGEILGIAGPTEAGKTTLLKLLWGFIRPDGGYIAILGMQPHLNQLCLRRFAGYLSQDPQYRSGCTAAEFLRFAGHFYEGWDETYAISLLNRFDIDPQAKLHMLSKGDCKKVGIVAACAHRPGVLLLDEPISGIDAASRREILDFLRGLSIDKKVSIVISCIVPAELDGIANNIVMLPAPIILHGLD